MKSEDYGALGLLHSLGRFEEARNVMRRPLLRWSLQAFGLVFGATQDSKSRFSSKNGQVGREPEEDDEERNVYEPGEEVNFRLARLEHLMERALLLSSSC